MASEHMLAGGQADEFAETVRAVLEHEPDNLDAVRLLVRFCSWQKDGDSLKNSLRRLGELAGLHGSLDDERFALSQLVMLMPQESGYATRLREVNELLGYDDETPVSNSMFDDRFLNRGVDAPSAGQDIEVADFAIVGAVIETSSGQALPFEVDESAIQTEEPFSAMTSEPLDDSLEGKRRREAESIRFYIDNGYIELAEKAIEEFESEFGAVAEVAELRAHLGGGVPASEALVQPKSNGHHKLFDIGEFRSELGLEEQEEADDSDFETKYSTAIAYKEMGLLEQAIAEFQDAAGIVSPNDGTRRFFSCANLLGHSFMENGMPKVAMKWYQRALEIADLTTDEKQALWYELGVVHESEGEFEVAGRYFEQVYAENVDFRDVRERLKNMAVAA